MICLGFIFLLVCGLLLTYSAALAQGTSATVTCKPQPALKTCPATPACQGILRKAYSVGCRNKQGKSLLDGGCQCKGYCGYRCLQGCQADPECTWDKTKKRCLNAATGLPSGRLQVCKRTLNPTTTPSRTPSKAPTTNPTATPTQPTFKPTSAPSQSPTVSYCRSDRKFLGVVNNTNSERGVVVSLSMSTNGKMILFLNRTYEYEGGKNYELWTTRQKSSGDWSSQLIESYETDDYVELSGALSGDGKYLVSQSRKPGPLLGTNTIITFYKLDSKNAFKKQKSFKYLTSESMGIWIDLKGIRAVVCFTATNTSPLSFKSVNFVRVNNVWTEEWVQPLRIDSISRGGTTALSLVYNDNEKLRQIYVRQGKQWILQAPDVQGTIGPNSDSGLYNRGLPASGFSSDGDAIVLGGLIASDDYSDIVIRESGAWVMERSAQGNWTQVGPKLGGEDNLYDARATAISDDLKTIVMSNGQEPQGFKVFRKSGSTWTQTGSKVLTTKCCSNIWLSADGSTVLTDFPPTIWRC